VSASVNRLIDEHQDRLQALFGWADGDFRVTVDLSRHSLVLQGQALLHRSVSSLQRRIARFVGGDWDVRSDVVLTSAGATRVQFSAGRVELWREHPLRRSVVSLTTEWLTTDGPVQALATVGGATLVRAGDGTVGWTVERSVRRGFHWRTDRHEREHWCRTALSFLGVPYRHGGTTPRGIDCSGLTQRLIRLVYGEVVPRHSTDQKAFLTVRNQAVNRRLIFSSGEGNAHVGILVGLANRAWVIHASSSRGCIVRDELDAYLELLGKAAHAPI
jgi:hypothetical protein